MNSNENNASATRDADAADVAHRSATRAKLAELQRKIAAGRIAGAPELSNEAAIGYDEHGLPV